MSSEPNNTCTRRFNIYIRIQRLLIRKLRYPHGHLKNGWRNFYCQPSKRHWHAWRRKWQFVQRLPYDLVSSLIWHRGWESFYFCFSTAFNRLPENLPSILVDVGSIEHELRYVRSVIYDVIFVVAGSLLLFMFLLFKTETSMLMAFRGCWCFYFLIHGMFS